MIKSLKFRLYAAAIGLVVVIFGFIYLFIPSTLVVTISPASNISGTASVRVDGQKTSTKLPASLKLRPGRHNLLITPENKLGAIDSQTLWLGPLTTKHVSVKLTAETELPGSRGAADNPYLSYLPHYTTYYDIEGLFSTDFTTLTGLKLTVRHLVNNTSSNAYQAERDQALAGAKDYLQSVGIPDSIPITIIDEN